MSQNILFIGLGNMGYPMACNLLKKDLQVYGFDLLTINKQNFEKVGGKWCSSLKDIAPKADVVISMLPGSSEMKKLYLENEKTILYFIRKNFDY